MTEAARSGARHSSHCCTPPPLLVAIALSSFLLLVAAAVVAGEQQQHHNSSSYHYSAVDSLRKAFGGRLPDWAVSVFRHGRVMHSYYARNGVDPWPLPSQWPKKNADDKGDQDDNDTTKLPAQVALVDGVCSGSKCCF